MVELLAPAGEYKSFIGALSAGADAVYLAGNMYGARASAVNFTSEEIISALKYAHLFNKKIYLTVNTLTKDEELNKLYDFLYPLYHEGLDGVIVQDIGVMLYIKEFFPGLEIHVSTQAVVTDKYGAKFYSDLGAKRVVLARELTLKEIEEINQTGVETECFIHGAMCYSYSGMCLFSSFLGGNSGNRGRCKGPCRQPYSVNGKEAYYLSLSDMNTVDIIDKLINAGIYSFKIEGRLKSPSYAAGVTSVYRKYIDYVLENPGKELLVSDEDRKLLNMLYSRTSTGHGYYDRVNSKKMVTIERGAYAKVDENIEKDIVGKYIDNPLKKDIDFSFEALTGNYALLRAVTDINGENVEITVVSDNPIEKANKLPTSKEDIFKQLNKLGNTSFKLKNCDININDGFVVSSMVNNLRREAVEQIEECVYERFRKDLNRNFDKTDNTSLYGLIDNYKKNNSLNKSIESSDFIVKSIGNDSPETAKNIINRAFVKNFEQAEAVKALNFYDSIVVSKEMALDTEFTSYFDNCSKDVFIEMPPILRSLNEKEFKELSEIAIKYSFIKGLYVNQYDAYEYLKENGFNKQICAGHNIYNYNSLSFEKNNELFDNVFTGIELSDKDLKNISSNAYVTMYGRAPLMYSANCIMKTSDKCTKFTKSGENSFVNLKDRLGVDFKVKLSCSDTLCFNTIYNSKPTSLHKYAEELKKRKIQGFSYEFSDETSEEIIKISKFYEGVLEGVANTPPFEFTSFHIKNGIL